MSRRTSFGLGIVAGVGGVWLLGRAALASPVMRMEFHRRTAPEELVLPRLSEEEAQRLSAEWTERRTAAAPRWEG